MQKGEVHFMHHLQHTQYYFLHLFSDDLWSLCWTIDIFVLYLTLCMHVALLCLECKLKLSIEKNFRIIGNKLYTDCIHTQYICLLYYLWAFRVRYVFWMVCSSLWKDHIMFYLQVLVALNSALTCWKEERRPAQVTYNT